MAEIDLADFISIVATQENVDESKLNKIQLMFRQIDSDRTGVITSSELDDIMRLNYPAELATNTVKHLLKPFESVQNAVLIDYRKFIQWLLSEVTILK